MDTYGAIARQGTDNRHHAPAEEMRRRRSVGAEDMRGDRSLGESARRMRDRAIGERSFAGAEEMGGDRRVAAAERTSDRAIRDRRNGAAEEDRRVDRSLGESAQRMRDRAVGDGRQLQSVQAMRQFLRTPKGGLIIVFAGLFALAATVIGWQLAVPHMLAAVLGASLTELAVSRLDRRPLAWPSSALLSGMIVGFVLGPSTPHAITAAVAILATLGKHLLATRRWHIFNPAALALLASVPLFGTGQSWWGALPDLGWPFALVLITAGVFIVNRINKFPLVLSFLGTIFALSAVLGRIDPITASEMFRTPFVQATLFLALFMLTDPPTAPSRYAEQVGIGILVAVASVVAEEIGLGQAYLLVGVLAGNLALATRRWLSQRRPVRHALVLEAQ